MLHRENILLHRGAYEKAFHANFLFISAFIGLQKTLLALPWRKDSKYVLRFIIQPSEGGKKIGQTIRQTNRQTDFFES